MDSPASGAFRGLRAAVLGIVCVALGLTGHLVGGGRAPSLWALLILGVPMGAVSLILTSRRRGLRAIGATVAVAQLSLHQALMWLTAGAACSVTGDPHAHLGHGTTGPALHCASMAGMGAPAGWVHLSLSAMLLGHVAAGVVTTLVLAYGESLLWRVWGQIVRLPLGGVLPVLAVRRLSLAGDQTPRTARVVAGPARRRGPPALAPIAS